tara:strand:- start:4082 stop:4330 length:249 start_codon:yes stop_codon:yes gene_type:complete
LPTKPVAPVTATTIFLPTAGASDAEALGDSALQRSARAFRRGGPVAGDRDWRAARQAHSAAGDALIGAAIMVAVQGRVPTVQ